MDIPLSNCLHHLVNNFASFVHIIHLRDHYISGLGSELNTDIGNKIYIGKIVSPGKFPEKPTDWLISSFNINQVEYVGDGTIDSTYPQNTNGRSYHWNVLTFGHPIRCTQIAFQAYIGEATDAENAMFIRSEHDYITTDWKQV